MREVTVSEVCALFAHLREPYHLMALLMYGAGLRLRECLRLRVKYVDVSYRQITMRDGKGGKDRVIRRQLLWPRVRIDSL